MTDFLTTNSQ